MNAAPQDSRPAVGESEELSTIEDARIVEASGIAASERFPGCAWIHNDSGDEARVFLVDVRSGKTRSTVKLAGATNVDWEDICLARGDAPDRFDVCVADIGDNNAKRESLAIYRFAEADIPRPPPPTIEVTPRRFAIRYADGPCDAESYAVHPKTGVGYVFTKRRSGGAAIYRMDRWETAGVYVCPRVGELRFPPTVPLETILTAADFSPDGRRLAARSYVCGWEWRIPSKSPVPAANEAVESLFSLTPERLPLTAESQGEGLGYERDGRALLTVSELPHPAINRFFVSRD
ncbi:MAG: hypothetical protein U1D55_15055 [Phycisphaerae bacterium]